jgi:hypothetical protein
MGPLEAFTIEVVCPGRFSMPQFGFYMAGVGLLGAGRFGLLLAWDPKERGPTAADSIDLSNIALYSWVGPWPTAAGAAFKMRSKSPLKLPAENCPATLDGAPDRDYVLRFGVKPGGSGASLIADYWLEVFEGSNRIYGFAPPASTPKVELASNSIATGLTEYSMQDRVTFQALEDSLEGWAWLMGGPLPGKEIWRSLMMSNQSLSWSPL